MFSIALVSIFAVLSASAFAQLEPPVHATLDSMRGGRRSLEAERGRRIVILFYEDRPHLQDNEQLKGNVRRFIETNNLRDRVLVYGVANLGDLGGAAPHDLVRRMIRPLIDRWGVEILLDWDGALRRPPFSFRTNSSNIAIVDRDGRIAFRSTGELDRTRTTAFYRALRRALNPQ
jgi:hypothetical protein